MSDLEVYEKEISDLKRKLKQAENDCVWLGNGQRSLEDIIQRKNLEIAELKQALEEKQNNVVKQDVAEIHIIFNGKEMMFESEIHNNQDITDVMWEAKEFMREVLRNESNI